MDMNAYIDRVSYFLEIRLGRMRNRKEKARELIESSSSFVKYCYDYFGHEDNDCEVCSEGIFLRDYYERFPEKVPDIAKAPNSCFNIRCAATSNLRQRHAKIQEMNQMLGIN